MQRLVASLCLAAALTANAQTAAPLDGWAKVQAQPKGLNIRVKATQNSGSCVLMTVTDDALTCNRKGTDVTYQRADIKRIGRSQRGRSTLIGFGIGAGAGALTGAGLGDNKSFVHKDAAAGILGAAFGVVGAVIGLATDFTRSTLYSSR